MYQSPRIRRLRNDLAALDRLRSDSSVFRFSETGNPPQQYFISFHGRGLCRERSKVKSLDHHRVEIKLGASYPRSMPEIRWVTPIYHPNISEIGMVCLGGYGTHWVPSLQLDELCVMLWDMVRFHNYDIRSPYNREAALWVSGQTTFRFPTDTRPLRDLRASQGRAASPLEKAPADSSLSRTGAHRANGRSSGRTRETTPVTRVLQFIERYGKVFGNAQAPDATPANANTQQFDARPDLAYLRRIIDRSASTSPRALAAELEAAVASHNAPDPLCAAAVPEATEIDARAASNNADAGDLMILEASTDTPRPETTLPDVDEIIFIE